MDYLGDGNNDNEDNDGHKVSFEDQTIGEVIGPHSVYQKAEDVAEPVSPTKNWRRKNKTNQCFNTRHKQRRAFKWRKRQCRVRRRARFGGGVVPTMIILRGCPGSGKSTWAETMGGSVYSTDTYFTHNGEYKFDPEQIGAAHAWNQRRVAGAVFSGELIIIIDNTNTQFWMMKWYVIIALKAGYRIVFKEINTPWSKDPFQLAELNSHNVPLDKIVDMVGNFQSDATIKKVLESQPPDRVVM